MRSVTAILNNEEFEEVRKLAEQEKISMSMAMKVIVAIYFESKYEETRILNWVRKHGQGYREPKEYPVV